jgi:GT2 family glycosyltransferase
MFERRLPGDAEYRLPESRRLRAYNDVDLCLRLRKAGWRLIWTPTVELFHHESASTGRHDAPHRRHEFRSAVALMRERWGTALDHDPYYNPNLSLRNAYHLAFPPRNPRP